VTQDSRVAQRREGPAIDKPRVEALVSCRKIDSSERRQVILPYRALGGEYANEAVDERRGKG
jgi:hypothetical protein